ncbi:hypothetical protein P1P75_21720 [Streptomyces sp. ID05-39B]|uniref:hypothetical protein n=1 Tax=Streptomyces sp. ID05-39B TaxID=3028664 RepID=UPI0029BE51A0|nr:hypothetical protein [Streptomyces sp. ID05-39B]MDX3528976.1 hypothetical protein [Streptomyces sp. ID05-39B]
MVLACVLELTDTSDGARFWWQYAAGAGHGAAAYCLYLHLLALGEPDTVDWWHRQTDDVQPSPEASVEEHDSGEHPDSPWRAAEHRITSTSTTTILRVLRHLAKYTVRPRPAAVTARGSRQRWRCSSAARPTPALDSLTVLTAGAQIPCDAASSAWQGCSPNAPESVA